MQDFSRTLGGYFAGKRKMLPASMKLKSSLSCCVDETASRPTSYLEIVLWHPHDDTVYLRRRILILLSHIHIGLRSILFYLCFRTRLLYLFIISRTSDKCGTCLCVRQ